VERLKWKYFRREYICMERLTRRNSHGSALTNFSKINQVDSFSWEVNIIAALACRLADYEDTGLEPDQIEDLKRGGRDNVVEV
jgi:hypothetical protein